MHEAKSPRFLTTDEVLTLHQAALDQYGGIDGIRDRGAFESAVAMPRQGFAGEYAHAFPFEMAAAYAFHIAENQAFLDGNKRTALSSAVTFLRLNGWSLVADELDAAQRILGFATKTQDKAGFSKWLEANSKPRPSMELREFFAAVTWEQFLAAFSAIAPDAPGTTQEAVVRTMDECRSHWPVADGLASSIVAAQQAGDEPGRITALAALKTAAALYRIAEDMGYEW